MSIDLSKYVEVYPYGCPNEDMVGLKRRIKLHDGQIKLFGAFDYVEEAVTIDDVVRLWYPDKGWKYFQLIDQASRPLVNSRLSSGIAETSEYL